MPRIKANLAKENLQADTFYRTVSNHLLGWLYYRPHRKVQGYCFEPEGMTASLQQA
jgi:hypothetical protein